jgi:molybdate transport system substrate-binding protein
MWVRSSIKISLLLALLPSLAQAEKIKVAAASDLALAFNELGAAYTKASGNEVVFSFGSTGLLEKQIEQGAPFDLFAAANQSFVDDAVKAGACDGKTKELYARGRLVIWWRKDLGLQPPATIADLTQPRFVKIAVANPAHAPYGKAAVEALKKAGVYDKVKGKLVYGENIQQTFQFAQSENAELALVALSLAMTTPSGGYIQVPQELHAPIDQALVVCGKEPKRVAAARGFASFVATPAGRAVMRKYGFLLPGEKQVTAGHAAP